MRLALRNWIHFKNNFNLVSHPAMPIVIITYYMHTTDRSRRYMIIYCDLYLYQPISSAISFTVVTIGQGFGHVNARIDAPIVVWAQLQRVFDAPNFQYTRLLLRSGHGQVTTPFVLRHVQAAQYRFFFYPVYDARRDQFFLGEIVPEKCHRGPRASPEIRKTTWVIIWWLSCDSKCLSLTYIYSVMNNEIKY